MEINKYITKKTLIYICIIIIILIIIRILYSTYTNNIIEGFDLSNNAATDLLQKFKSPETQLLANQDNKNLEMQIYLWRNKINNLENPLLKLKPIAFYKPNLTINKVRYAKLGDIVSQNSDYSLPSFDQFTLLIKKGTSDIKPPIRFDLIAEIKNPSFNTIYYTYSRYIDESVNFNAISESLKRCSTVITDLNSLIQNNLSSLQKPITDSALNSYNVNANTNGISVPQLLNKLSTTSQHNTPIEKTGNTFSIASGTTGYITFNGQRIDISVAGDLDSYPNKAAVLNALPYTPYGKLKESNIVRTSKTTNIFGNIQNDSVFIYVKGICNDIKNIYNNSQPLPNGEDRNLLEYLKLAPSITAVNSVLAYLEGLNKDLFQNVEGFVDLTKAEQDAKAYVAAKKLADEETSNLLKTDLIEKQEDAAIIFADNLASPYNAVAIAAEKAAADKIAADAAAAKAATDAAASKAAADALKVFKIENITGLNINSITSTTTLLELVLYIINNTNVTNNITTLNFTIEDLVGVDAKSKPYANTLGCYADSNYDFTNKEKPYDNSYRAIPNLIGYLDGQTERAKIQQCTEAAYKLGYDTIGIQAGGECWGATDPDYRKYGSSKADCGMLGSAWNNHVYKIKTNSLTITGYNNNIITNISSSNFNLLTNNTWITKKKLETITNNLFNPLQSFKNFVIDFIDGKIGYFPLQIYKPIAPENYTSLGNVFCNTTTDLQKIIKSNNVACVPSHCVKEMREWTKNDKIFEFNVNNTYFGIYFNPYTGTFITTNTNANQLPEGKVCKVVACVKKCTVIDDLEKSEDCSRKYYNLNKQSTESTPLNSNLVSSQEEEYYLDKIKAQSDSITRLKKRAQQMQTDVDKSTIVNREMNKSKLQNYVDTQKSNIDIIMKRLQDDKNKIKTDVNIPLQTLKDIIDMIKNSSYLNSDQKNILLNKVNKLATSQNLSGSQYNKNLNEILSSCPQYDISDLVSKKNASDVCYGCDIPM